ncbi:TetR/AcrR family transcriptional regulator [Marinisporobacter balticus]|uniref:TetR family transcriptional regulator n=1 Tax=Marinisporobacter balticus TaxID=2018667 RepID=A0A4R2KN97_9FIRM|nr:TetR/AcrR family transcriptional regulator [Marinisporobacter balticus]TCO72276.1 TetR family transcriptional regulator [Marinisporobacter balticus]
MARKIDPKKIEKVKKAAIEMMIQYGYKGASIANIAKKAGVSTGYLYRYYSSKEALVEDLVETYIKETKEGMTKTFSQNKSWQEMIYDFVWILFQKAKEDLFIMKFIITLMFESTFEGKSQKKEKELHECMQKIVDIGLIRKEINEKVTVEEVIIVLTTIPFMYVAQKIEKENYKELLNEKSAKRIAEICINALK